MNNTTIAFFIFIFSTITGCQQTSKDANESDDHITENSLYKTVGHIERLDSAINKLISSKAKIEVLDSGFNWTEGPLWLDKQNMLLFSDAPVNTVYQWTENNGVRVYLSPSGYTGEKTRGGESGSNGLFLDNDGNLILCQHGDRQVAQMNAALDDPTSDFITLSGNYKGEKLNSPNDGCISKVGTIYFTDPPYGLEGNVDDPAKEIDFQGVYQITTSGQTKLITDKLTRPNGIALTPDGKHLMVSNSDPEAALWMIFPVTDDIVGEGHVFLNVTDQVSEANKGLPDGLKFDGEGNLYASGPGGIWIISPEAKVLGKIQTGGIISNCSFNKDKSILYMSADKKIMRLKLH